MSERLAAAEERAGALRKELEEVGRALARFPDPPEPLTAGELAARAFSGRSRPGAAAIPAPPADAASGTIAAARAELAAGRRSAVDLVEEALERARTGRHLGAFLRLREEEALAEARRLTESPEGAGQGDGGGRPLLGIPLSVKDIVDVAGMTTTSGSKFPHEAARSAPAWSRLSEAGAVLLGKNNLQEFAFGVSGDNPTFGRTRNPHGPARIPGGSSSGSAVAVATGMGFGSVGTDTGGSIRIPASLNGVFGLKPSYGAVSRAGVTPLSWSLDHVGPIARSAGDIALLFEVLSGWSSGPATPPAKGPKPLEGVRVGVPLDFFYTDLIREARQAADGIVAALVRLGAERVEVRIPEVEFSGVCRNVLAFAEAAVVHRERLAIRPEDISEDVRRLLEVGTVLSAPDLIAALRGRRLVADAFAQLLEEVDLLVAPSTPAGAPPAGEPLATSEDIRPGLIRLVGPFNFTGLPALSVPAGLDAPGMPLGAQLVGGPGQDFAVIRVAAWLEASGAIPMRQPSLGGPQ
ncbi:MAG: amidase [Acidobacteria bacterium]|nr:amidase [Acidobacteriota bacterium]MYA45419.1 amidase [Acidobacteriota bacterium]MYI38545.1 amidase [Acidobacteriota bacterium]